MPKGIDTQTMANIINYLKDKLSPEDLAGLRDIVGLEYTRAGQATEMQEAGHQALEQALTETEGTGVTTTGAHDTARSVYCRALNRMGLDGNALRNLPFRRLRSEFLKERNRRVINDEPLIAMDSASHADLAKRFPHAATIKRAW